VILVERTQYPEGFEAFPEAAKERFFLYRSEVRNVFRALATVTVASEDKFIVDAIHAIFQQYEAADSGAPLPTNVRVPLNSWGAQQELTMSCVCMRCLVVAAYRSLCARAQCVIKIDSRRRHFPRP
jgi:hypothetical protein